MELRRTKGVTLNRVEPDTFSHADDRRNASTRRRAMGL
jgi:hypothetical protein